MTPMVHRADERGIADYGWLHSRHSFSFGDWFDPSRTGFGRLLVLNDDVVGPDRGFPSHGHSNMEIVSIPLSGALRHKDSEGNEHIIHPDEVQIMSAGTGIRHSEYNHSADETVNFLQIWVRPERQNLAPRYQQQSFDRDGRHNRFQTVVSPDGADGSVRITQQAWFSLADFDAGSRGSLRPQRAGNGLYLFLIGGQLEIAGETLGPRDAIALADPGEIGFTVPETSRILCIEIPLD